MLCHTGNCVLSHTIKFACNSQFIFWVNIESISFIFYQYCKINNTYWPFYDILWVIGCEVTQCQCDTVTHVEPKHLNQFSIQTISVWKWLLGLDFYIQEMPGTFTKCCRKPTIWQHKKVKSQSVHIINKKTVSPFICFNTIPQWRRPRPRYK